VTAPVAAPAVDPPDAIDTGEFHATWTAERDVGRVQLRGCADRSTTGLLGAFLQGVHRTAVLSQLRLVIVDVREVEFLNSSCLTCFIRWLRQLQIGPGDTYRLRFLRNPTHRWQQRSLHALRCFATDLVEIQ
jgi:hypothetical protein